MISWQYLKEMVTPEVYLEISFCEKKLNYDLDLPAGVVRLILEQIEWFFETYPYIRITVKMVFAVIVFYYANRAGFMSRTQVCNVFELNVSWHRKKYPEYVSRMIHEDLECQSEEISFHNWNSSHSKSNYTNVAHGSKPVSYSSLIGKMGFLFSF